MLAAPAIITPALDLRRALDAGDLLTPLAAALCGQDVTVTGLRRVNPPLLFRHEAEQMGIGEQENWACLRRSGMLAQADGTAIGPVTSVVLLSGITPAEHEALAQTDIPLGTVLGPAASSLVLWCGICISEYAISCGRLVSRDGKAVALTTDRVLWSWCGNLPARAAVRLCG